MKKDLTFACYELREDAIVVLKLIDELMIDLEKATLMDAALHRMTIGKPRMVFVPNGKYTSADGVARKFLTGNAKSKQIEKVSVTMHSLSQRILANFFIKVNKPPFPIRFFNSASPVEK